MGVFILIVVWNFLPGAAAISQEFSSERACAYAAEQVKQESRAVRLALCVPKNDGKEQP